MLVNEYYSKKELQTARKKLFLVKKSAADAIKKKYKSTNRILGKGSFGTVVQFYELADNK